MYRLLRVLLRLSLKGFFRHVDLPGRELIPTRGPVLFVSNHTNAFIDPLPILTGIDRRVTLTAKRTLARNPLLAVFIRALGIILFERAVDRPSGAGPSDNVGAFAACVARLREGGAVFIFPEGVSHSDPAMREFKSGAARIVAQFLESEPSQELWIVPVGMHFSQKSRWRSEAVALIGEPIGARAWTGGSVDVRALTRAMRSWIESLTVNFASADERDLLTGAGRLLTWQPEGPAPLDRRTGMDAEAHVALVHRLQRGVHHLHERDPLRFAALAGETRTLLHEIESRGVAVPEVSLSMHAGRVALFVLRELEVLAVGAPLALAGAVLHQPPLSLTRRLVASLSKDEDHPASNAVILSIPIFVAWWLILGLATLFLLSPAWVPFVAVAVPYAGLVNLHYRDRAGGVVRRVRTFLLWWRRPDLLARLEDSIQRWQEQIRAIETDLIDAPTSPPEMS